VVELVGGRGQVRVTVTGDVGDVEGYPPISPDLRSEIRDGEWTFPADIPIPELETRFADRLQSEFHLEAVEVSINEEAKASVAAAPPSGGVSRRLKSGARAVSVATLVPTGLARGDEVTVVTDDGELDATVVGITAAADSPESDTEAADEDDGRPPVAPRAPTAEGGDGSVTLAVARSDVESLLGSDVRRLEVRSRGVRREFELVSLLRRAGKRFARVTPTTEGALDDVTLREAEVRETYGVAVLAVRHEGAWKIAPRGDHRVCAGDTVFAVGTRSDLNRFTEVVT
jgi:hypothetical protein